MRTMQFHCLTPRTHSPLRSCLLLLISANQKLRPLGYVAGAVTSYWKLGGGAGYFPKWVLVSAILCHRLHPEKGLTNLGLTVEKLTATM